MPTRDEEIAALQEEVNALKKELTKLQGDLKLYREDFETLEAAQDSLAQLNAIVDYNDHVIKALGNSNESIVATCNKYDVPGLKELMVEFDTTMDSSLSSISSNNSNCTSDFDEAGQRIDQAKAEAATGIERLNHEITACEIKIEDLEMRILSI